MPARAFTACVLVALSLLGGACDATTLDVPEDQNQVAIELSGALTSSFEAGTAAYFGTAHVVEDDAGARLRVFLQARDRADGQQEEAAVSFQLRLDTEQGVPVPGEYTVRADHPGAEVGEVSYHRSDGGTSYARYHLVGSSLAVRIEPGAPGRVVGRFSLALEQRSGQRLWEGQLEEVTLAGGVGARGRFDLDVRGMQ